LHLRLLDPTFAIVRLDGDAPLPPWFELDRPLAAAIRREDELSLLVADARVPGDVAAERGWRAFEVAGPLDLSLTGITAELAGALAEAGVPIMPLATHDTDVILVRDARVEDAMHALRAAGHTVSP
jgi:hypothetical protein